MFERSKAPGPPLLVPSLLWGGGGESGSLHKVPLHTFGAAKRRYLRLKPFVNNGNASLEVALVDNQKDSTKKYYIVKAASPPALVWNDPKSDNNPALLSSPFKRARDNEHEILLQDIIRITGGHHTAAFQAFIAKNGNWSIPNEACCFSLISAKRSVDFYVLSTGGNVNGKDSKLANAWKESIQTLLDNFHRKQNALDPIGSISSSSNTVLRAINQRWDPKLHSESLFEAAKCGDIGTLRWFFDHGCPIDFMDATTGDSVLMVACRLGLFDVARLALLGYHARNDVHPEFGQTALQVAVSAGHTSIVKLILETAEHSGANTIIANHEDENGEAPLHVAARSGSREAMELLVMHGANLGLVDGRGRTCLHLSAQAGQESCLIFALDCGADEYLEVLTNDGFTPLHLAVRANKSDCVKVLLQAGAHVSSETAGGSNVYNLASKQRSERIMKLLLEYDVSEGDSYYDSYDEDDDDSSISGEDMFRGLNTYAVSPAAKQPIAGGLVSPSHPLNYCNGSRAGGASRHHSTFAGGSIVPPLDLDRHQTIHSPNVGANCLYADSGGNFSRYSLQQNQGRHDASHCGSEECNNGEYDCCEGEEFIYEGEIWTSYVTHDGHPYFYNARTDSSQWDDPRSTHLKSVSFRTTPLAVSTFKHDSREGCHTPQYLQELPTTFGNVSATRNVSGENHDKQIRAGPSTPSYTKKLTAIPQPGNIATFDASTKSASPGGTVSAHITMAGATNPFVAPPAPSSTSGSVSASISMASAASPKPAENTTQAGKRIDGSQRQATSLHHQLRSTTTCTTVYDAESNSSKTLMKVPPTAEPKADRNEVDPKSMLLAQLKSHALGNGRSILANTQNPLIQLNTLSSEKRKTDEAVADPKSMLLSQIKSHNAGTDSDIRSAPPTTAASNNAKNSKDPSEGLDTPNASRESTKEDAKFAKYMKMKAVGIPVPAIVQKMTQDGIDVTKIERFRSFCGIGEQPVAPSPKVEKAPLSTQSPMRQSKDQLKKALLDDQDVKRFMRMSSVGVPAQAVAHKMKQEGVDASKIDKFKELHGLVPTAAATLPAPPQRKAPSTKIKVAKEDLAKDSAFSKYLSMSKVGVPLMAIVTKMAQDGIEKEKIHMFGAAFGLKASTSASTKPFPMPPMPRDRRRASKALQKIHWTTVAEERLENSLWASNGNGEEDKIEDCEIEKLESLFSASPIKKTSGVGRKKIVAKSNNNKMQSSLVDPKRANNIAIALAQFRAFSNFDDLCQAVASLDPEHLSVEKLSNMQLLLPKPEESNKLEHFSGLGDSLGRAELFFLSVMKVPRFPQKLAAFKYSLQFDEQAQSLSSPLRLLAKACDEVVENKKLAGLLRRLLAIGNIMNESAGKPKANGITLDSLIKTAKKKGSDGKTTVLDHLVATAMNNKLDIVDFWSEMPAVRDAMRLDLDDFRSLLRECESGAQSAARSIETEKSELKSRDVSSASDASIKFIQKLEPFLRQAMVEIEGIKNLLGNVEGKVQLLCSFFAEDFKTCKASTIFGVLLDFSRLVDKSKEQHVRKVKAAKRRESMTKNM